jgi:Sec-independent protein translocase protein TatA
VDTLCGVGLPELIILALVIFVVVGPERARDVALTLGRWLRRLITSEWWKEFNQIARAIQDLPNTLVRMAEIEEAQAELKRAMSEIDQLTGKPFSPTAGQQPPPADPWGILNLTQQPPSPTSPSADDEHVSNT